METSVDTSRRHLPALPGQGWFLSEVGSQKSHEKHPSSAPQRVLEPLKTWVTRDSWLRAWLCLTASPGRLQTPVCLDSVGSGREHPPHPHPHRRPGVLQDISLRPPLLCEILCFRVRGALCPGSTYRAQEDDNSSSHGCFEPSRSKHLLPWKPLSAPVPLSPTGWQPERWRRARMSVNFTEN